jgi:CRISPR-associated protein Csx17
MYHLLLEGCRTKPMAGYLKALGLLRIVAEQCDPQAKGFWKGDAFCLRTFLNREELAAFFCEKYAPTPILSPWNGGSGFYLGDAVEGINAIEQSMDSRLGAYREAISQIKHWPEIPVPKTVKDVIGSIHDTITRMNKGRERDELEGLIRTEEQSRPKGRALEGLKLLELSLEEAESMAKPRTGGKSWQAWWAVVKKARSKVNNAARKNNKSFVIPKCRSLLSDSALSWVDAVCSITAEDKPSYNRILGSGGNEGRLEVSNQFMQKIAAILLDSSQEYTLGLFESSVFGSVSAGLQEAKIGFYDPGRAGGYNQGMEIETKDFKVNPWDYVLLVEGSVLLSGTTVRRYGLSGDTTSTAPFTVHFSPVGFSSSADLDRGRYEIWLPVWRNPASLAEVKYLFGEGRAVIGRKPARTGIDFARSLGTLGTDRGVNAFERFALLERRGKSYVALPAGRLAVRYRPKLAILSELDPIIDRLGFYMKSFQSVPAAMQRAHRQMEESIFECSQKDDPSAFVSLMRAVGRMESLIALRDRSKEPVLNFPLYGLSPRWLSICDDNGVEVRIAAALASIRATGRVGPIRSTASGVDKRNPRRWGDGPVTWYGNNLPERLAGVFMRRMMEADRTSTRGIPAEGFLSLPPEDVVPFLHGECDDEKIEDLFRAFTLIDWWLPDLKEQRSRLVQPLGSNPLPRVWCLLKLLHSTGNVGEVNIRREPRICPLLLAGRVKEACHDALRRLRVSGLNPYNVSYESEIDSIRLVASFLIPVRNRWQLESLVLKQNEQ